MGSMNPKGSGSGGSVCVKAFDHPILSHRLSVNQHESSVLLTCLCKEIPLTVKVC